MQRQPKPLLCLNRLLRLCRIRGRMKHTSSCNSNCSGPEATRLLLPLWGESAPSFHLSIRDSTKSTKVSLAPLSTRISPTKGLKDHHHQASHLLRISQFSKLITTIMSALLTAGAIRLPYQGPRLSRRQMRREEMMVRNQIFLLGFLCRIDFISKRIQSPELMRKKDAGY